MKFESGDDQIAALAELLPDVVIVFGPDLRVTYANSVALSLAQRELVGRHVDTFERFTARPDAERLRAAVAAAMPVTFEFPLGEVVLDIRVVPQTVDDEVRDVILLGRDITEIVRQRDERQHQLDLLARQVKLLDRAGESINVCDGEGRITYWNAASERLYGWTAAEAIGQQVEGLLSAATPAERDEYADTLMRTGVWNGRAMQRRRSGEQFVADLTLAIVGDAESGDHHVMAIASDVTERVELEHRLQQAERVEAIGRLAGGVAHDFNNLLTVILAAADALAMHLDGDHAGTTLVRSIVRSAQRGASLTEQLLSFGRRQSLQPVALALVPTIRDLAELLQRAITTRNSLEIHVPIDTWPILVDPGQLELALVNLFLNARDALDGHGGAVRLHAANVVDDRVLGSGEVVRGGRFVEIVVTDDGHGMTDDVRARAVEPFFSTKGPGAGSGLGLSMVHGFTLQSGGHLAIRSDPGHGTTVTLYLPRAEVPRHTPPAGDDQAARADGDGRLVLVVEDDDDVRELAVTMVGSLGYRTLSAPSGEAAMLVVAARPDIDLVFTDIVMRGMDGIELADRVRSLRPDLPIVFTSGFIGDTTENGREVPRPLLRKPYQRASLSRSLADALGVPVA